MASKNEGNHILKNALILCGITLVAGLLLGLVYQITLDPIAKQKAQASLKAYQQVYADAAAFEESERLDQQIEAINAAFVGGEDGRDWQKISISEAKSAVDGSGKQLGYVLQVVTKEGYGGSITLSMGVDLEGKVQGVQILSHGESPGLGANAVNESFRGQYTGKASDDLQVVKTGTPGENEIQAITGATITSKAVTRAVNAGIYFVNEAKEAESK